MGISGSRQIAALIAAVLVVAFGLLVFSAPARPKVAVAGPGSRYCGSLHARQPNWPRGYL